MCFFVYFGFTTKRMTNFTFYRLDSFSFINFRSVSFRQGCPSALWQMSLFRRSVEEKKCQDCSFDSWEHRVPYKEEQQSVVLHHVHELALQAALSRRWCVRQSPIFRTLVPADDSGTRITLLQITSSSQCFCRYFHPLVQIYMAVQDIHWIPV